MSSSIPNLSPSEREVAEALSRGWWLLLVWGLVSIVAGIAVLAFDWTSESLAIFVGACFLVAGVFRAFEFRSGGPTVGPPPAPAT